MKPVHAAAFSLLFAALAAAADKPVGLPKTSPFVAPGTASAPAEAAAENIEFAGVSTVGKKTDLIFHDKAAKRNHWIAKGETKAGIAVLNYDEQREQVVVKVNGVEKTLALRKGAKPGAAPRPVAPQPTGFNIPTAPVAMLPAPGGAQPVPSVSAAGAPAGTSTPVLTFESAPAAPAAPATPEAIQARQETEARMLVSDLLEIGMAQRKAYEEAQRKAATEGGTPAPPPADPNQAAR